MSAALQFGRTENGIPCLRGGEGPRHAVILVGASSLFRPLGASEGERYGRLLSKLLPGEYRYTILGYADHPEDGHSLDSIVEATATAIRSDASTPGAASGPSDVIGISFGGFVALRLAARHPDLVGRLVLLVSAHRFSDEGLRRVTDQLRLLCEGDVHGLVVANAVLFRRPWFNWMVRLRLWMQRGSLAARLYDPLAVLRSYERMFPERKISLKLDARQVTAETLVIGGTEDQYFDRAAFEETGRLIPSASVVLVPGETHMLPVENSASVKRALAAFLGQAVPSRQTSVPV